MCDAAIMRLTKESRAAQELARREQEQEQRADFNEEHNALRRYMRVVLKIHARLKADPEQWRRARTLIEKRTQEKDAVNKDQSGQLELF